MSAYGFVARTSNETTPKPRSAAVSPARSLVGTDGTPRRQPLPGDRPAEERHHAEPEQRDHGPVAGDRERRARRPRGPRRPGAEEAEDVERGPTKSQKASACAGCARPGRAGCADVGSARRGRPPPTRNGTSSANSTSSIAQPRTIRAPAQTNVVVPCASSRPWSSDPMICCAARPRAVRRGVAQLRRAVGEGPGRALACSRERHGRHAARDERPLLVEREREAEVDQLVEDARACRGSTPGLLERPARAAVCDERRRRRAWACRLL